MAVALHWGDHQLANHGLRAYSHSRVFNWAARGRVFDKRRIQGFLRGHTPQRSYYESAGVVEVVKGRTNAESALKKFESDQSPADRHEGWRFFLEKTTLKAGTDPAEATELRQAELESRESKATQEGEGSNNRGGNLQVSYRATVIRLLT